MRKIKKGDPVIVIAGKHKGKVSTLERFVDAERVIVAGVNEVKKAKKGE
jgi:large subunit ribosomal protein L24